MHHRSRGELPGGDGSWDGKLGREKLDPGTKEMGLALLRGKELRPFGVRMLRNGKRPYDSGSVILDWFSGTAAEGVWLAST